MTFGGLMALNNFSLELASGELHGLIGPNGAGKTTVFNLLTGFYRPTDGEIIFNGAPITGLPPQAIARLGIARTFQNIRLFQELSVLDNVLIPFHSRSRINFWQAVLRSPRFRREEKTFRQQAWELLEKLQLQDRGPEKRPAACPMASSAAWRLPGPWLPRPNSCFWMSRLPV